MKTLSSNRKLFFKLPPTPHPSSITLQPSPLSLQSYGWRRSLTLMKPFLYPLFSALQFCSVILHHIARRNNPPTSKPNLHHPSLWQCPAASWYGEGGVEGLSFSSCCCLYYGPTYMLPPCHWYS